MNLRKLVIFSLLFFCCEQNQSKNQRDNNLEYNPEKRLEQLGIKIPEVSPPVENYVRVVKSGNLLFLSGSGPKKADGLYITGKLGKELTIEDGYQAAWLTGVNHIATLKSELGNLNRLKKIVKVLGMVNSSPEFHDQPKVINGFSDLMVEVFGDRGKHARSAVGMAALPLGLAVEIELIVEVE